MGTAMDSLTWGLLCTFATVLHVVVAAPRLGGFFSLSNLFCLAQWQTAIGTLAILDERNAVDRLYAAVVSVPLLLYVGTSLTLSLLSPPAYRPTAKSPVARIAIPTLAMWLLITLSAVITIGYFRSVGYNVFALALQNMASGGSSDYTTLRLESYSGNKYFFPGYVNQFKNSILPALTVVTGIYLFKRKHPFRWLVTGAFAIVGVYGILGTGQRSALFIFLFTTVIFIRHYNPRRFRTRLLVILGIAGPFLLLMTFFLGRSKDQLATSSSPLQSVLTLVREVVKRLFYDNQFSGQMAFHFTYPSGVQNGHEWWVAVTGILPGREGTRVASDTFKMLYGTDRGTAPPSLWGSTYYNFGMSGVIFLGVALAIACAFVSRKARPGMNTFELIGMAGFVAVCANWVASGPEFLLNTGAVTYAILWYWGSRLGPNNTILQEALAEDPDHHQASVGA